MPPLPEIDSEHTVINYIASSGIAATIIALSSTQLTLPFDADEMLLPVQIPAQAIATIRESNELPISQSLAWLDIDQLSELGLDIDNIHVLAQLWPDETLLATMHNGASFNLLPFAHSSQPENGQIHIRGDVATIPSAYVGPDRIIDVRLTAWDAKNYVDINVSLPVTANESPQSSAPSTFGQSITKKLGRKTPGYTAKKRTNSVQVSIDDLTLRPTEMVDKTTIQKIWTECTTTQITRGMMRNAVIGDGLPAIGQKSSFFFDVGQSVSLGVATSTTGAYGEWASSGSVTKSSNFTQDWGASSTRRFYAIEVEMAKYTQKCYVVSGSTKTYAYTQYELRPLTLTGGTSAITTAYAPNWTYCVNIAEGTWTRGISTGAAYSNSVGLSLTSTFGVALSTSGQYGSNQTLRLHQGAGFQACGNNTYPATASRIMGKK